MDSHGPLNEPVPLPPDLLPKVPVLRREHGDLFLSMIGEQVYAYRPLTLNEYLDYQTLLAEDPNAAEEIVLGAVVWPENGKELLDSEGFGAVENLLQEILGVSNIPSVEILNQALAEQRALAHSADAAMAGFICAAFPAYTPDRVFDLPQIKILRLVAMAERILGRPLEFEDPNAPKNKKGKKPPPPRKR